MQTEPTDQGLKDQLGEITQVLQLSAAGDEHARNTLASLVYQDLRRIAANRMAGEANDSMGVTGLVHEAFLRLEQTVSMKFSNRRHFYGAAAQAMRRILVERARYHSAQKRGQKVAGIAIEELGVEIEGLSTDQMLSLDQVLDALDQFDAELATLVKLKFFVGLSTTEIAQVMGSSVRTTERRWRAARAWLASELD